VLTIEWEPIDSLIASGLEDLAIMHWNEAERDQHEVPLALDFDRCRAFEKAGQHVSAALRKDGSLVGYATFTLMTAMFHKTVLHAFCNAIYVEPEHRGPASLWLIHWCEKRLEQRGVRKIYIASKTATLSDLLTKLGYEWSETVHCKLLGGPHGQQQSRARSVPAA